MNVRRCDKVIQELSNTSDVYLRIQPIGLDAGVWLVFSDASLGNDEDQGPGTRAKAASSWHFAARPS